MAQSTGVEMPGYIIYRDVAPNHTFDPTTPLAFFPPKGSDELFDALRAKYPTLKSHAERVREAVIEFLGEESQVDHTPVHQISSPSMPQLDNSLTSIYAFAGHSAVSDTSTWSSPDTLSLAASSFEDSPRTQHSSRHFSSATSGTDAGDASPPALDQMTGVFSLSDSSQPKQRVRRKMTDQEKVEYRKRRIVKACESCSKKKRKCNHNQSEMETVASKSQKIPRSSGTSTSKARFRDQDLSQILGPEQNLAMMPVEFDDPSRCELMHAFDGLDPLLEPPLPDLTLDDLLAPSTMQWPWTHTPDFTLMDSSGDGFAPRPQNELPGEHDLSSRQPALFSDSELLHDDNLNLFAFENNIDTSMDLEHERSGQGDATVFDGEDMRRRRPDGDHANRNVISASQRNIPVREIDYTEKLAQATLRLVGTARAARAFGCLMGHNSNTRAPLTSASVASVARAVQVSFDRVAVRSNVARTTSSPDDVLMRPSVGVFGDRPRVATSAEQQNHNGALQRNPTDEHRTIPPDTVTTSWMRCLHEAPSFSNLITTYPGSQQRHAILSQAGTEKRLVMSSTSLEQNTEVNGVLGLTSKEEQRLPSAQSPRSLSLGEMSGATLTSTSPNAELFMLRRRIPKGSQKTVERNGMCTKEPMLPQPTQSQLRVQSQRVEGGVHTVTCNTSQSNVSASQVDRSAVRHMNSVVNNTNVSAVSLHPTRSVDIVSVDAVSDCTGCGDLPTYAHQDDVHQDRLSDHVRRRDHFGRHLDNQSHVLLAAAGLGCALVLLSLLPSGCSNVSLILLALLSPVGGAKGTHIPRRSCVSEAWGTSIHHTLKNSARYTRIDTQMSRLHQLATSAWSKEIDKMSGGNLRSIPDRCYRALGRGRVDARVC